MNSYVCMKILFKLHPIQYNNLYQLHIFQLKHVHYIFQNNFTVTILRNRIDSKVTNYYGLYKFYMQLMTMVTLVARTLLLLKSIR